MVLKGGLNAKLDPFVEVCVKRHAHDEPVISLQRQMQTSHVRHAKSDVLQHLREMVNDDAVVNCQALEVD